MSDAALRLKVYFDRLSAYHFRIQMLKEVHQLRLKVTFKSLLVNSFRLIFLRIDVEHLLSIIS